MTIWRPAGVTGDVNDATTQHISNTGYPTVPATSFHVDLTTVATPLLAYPRFSDQVQMVVRFSHSSPSSLSVYGSSVTDSDTAFGEEHQWYADFAYGGSGAIEEIRSTIYGYSPTIGEDIGICPFAHFFGLGTVHEMWIEYPGSGSGGDGGGDGGNGGNGGGNGGNGGGGSGGGGSGGSGGGSGSGGGGGPQPILQGTPPKQDELYANFKPVRYRYVMTYLHDEVETLPDGSTDLHRTGEVLAILPMTSVTYGVSMYVGTEMSGNVALPEMTLLQMPHPPLNSFERRPHPDRSGNPVGAMFECGNRGMYVMRNDEVVWGGILWTRSYSSGTPQLAVTALSFEGYIYYRLLRLTIDFRAVTNMYTIWWAVLRQTFNDFDGTFTGPGSGLTGRDALSEPVIPPEDASDPGTSGSTTKKHKWEPKSKTDRTCGFKIDGKVCGRARANTNWHTNPGPNAGGGTGDGGGGGHHQNTAEWDPAPGSGVHSLMSVGGSGGSGHHKVDVQDSAPPPPPEITTFADGEPDPDPVADDENIPHFTQWTGFTQLPWSNAPFVNYKHSWPHNSVDIELPPSGLKLYNDRGEMMAKKAWRGYDMAFVGPLLQEWADTETVASFEGGKRFEYRVLCWYDTVQQRFRQRYVCGEMSYPENQDPNNPQPNGILRPLLGTNTKLMAQSPDNVLIFDFPGTISSWSLGESMEEAATRYLVSDNYEEATKHVAYGWDEVLLNVPVNDGSQGWRLYDKTTEYDTTDQAMIKSRAETLITLFKVPQAAQLQDLDAASTGSTLHQRTSARSTSLDITLYTSPDLPFPEFQLGDWAAFAIEDPFYGGKMYLVRRIIGYAITVVPEQESDYSHESITLELTDDSQIAIS